MYPTELDFLARQEQYKDLLREAERERLIRATAPQSPGLWGLSQQVANWLGAQMVKWGSKPHPSSPRAVACCSQSC